MTYPVVFATLTAGNQPLSDFDTMFNVTGQQGNIPTTPTGTNALTLTPATNYYLPAAYTNGQMASFLAGNTSTGNMTVQIGGLGFVELFKSTAAQASTGDIVSGSHYVIQYWGDLNSGSGGFLIINSGSALGASLSTPDQTLSGGANVTSYQIGVITSGAVTVDCGKCPLQTLTNNGAFVFNPPTLDGSCAILIANGTAPGAVTFSTGTAASGLIWTVGNNIGDAFVTATGDNFILSVMRITTVSGTGVSTYFWKALQ